MNHKVKLLDRDGRFVTQVEIPPFAAVPPTVVVWGSRVFLINGDNVYKEVFSYVIPLHPKQL